MCPTNLSKSDNPTNKIVRSLARFWQRFAALECGDFSGFARQNETTATSVAVTWSDGIV